MGKTKPIFHKLETVAYNVLVQVRMDAEMVEKSLKSLEGLVGRYPDLVKVQAAMQDDVDNLQSVDASICALFPKLDGDVARHLGQAKVFMKGGKKTNKGRDTARLTHPEYPNCQHCRIKVSPDNLKTHEKKCSQNPKNKKDLKCQYCKRPCKGGTGKAAHERSCPENPKKAPKKKAAKKSSKKSTQTKLKVGTPVTAKYLCDACGHPQKMAYVGAKKDCPKCSAHKTMQVIKRYDAKGVEIILTSEENARI